jgi:predicted nucleic acid-binding protein
MPPAISNTSPLLYLHRINGLGWLQQLFGEVWVPEAVVQELNEGARRGFDVPNVEDYDWLTIVTPNHTPSEWLALDLGIGEIAAMALALENPDRIIILDDALARRTAQAAGLEVWGTLRILLEAKAHGLIEAVKPTIDQLNQAGLWMSAEIRQRILALAGEE